MDLEEAKSIINASLDKRLFRLVRAAAIICAPENANRVSISELLQCLKRGSESKEFSLIAEYAATALYTRTKREWKMGVVAITDVDDWTKYLEGHHLI